MYKKNSHRLEVKFIDPQTNDLLFDVKDRSWMDIGEFFTDHYVNDLVKRTLGDKAPENVLVLVTAVYSKNG